QWSRGAGEQKTIEATTGEFGVASFSAIPAEAECRVEIALPTSVSPMVELLEGLAIETAAPFSFANDKWKLRAEFYPGATAEFGALALTLLPAAAPSADTSNLR